MDRLLHLEFDYPDLPIGFVSRASHLDPEELRAGVGLGLCNREFASQLRSHGLVSEQLRLRPFDVATFKPERSNPAWIWFLDQHQVAAEAKIGGTLAQRIATATVTGDQQL